MSALVYAFFSGAVFVVQGGRPLLGSDHLSYFQLADTIIATCPAGDYWRETTSVRTFGVLLAYLNGWTESHVLSMKVVLAVFTVLYLLAAELLFRLFTDSRWQAVLFALLSGFAVSFGIASWGVTDSTALLPRTLVAPVVMVTMWLWFRHDGSPVKYLAFSILVLGSLLHLSTFHVAAVLLIMEALDFVVLRRMRFDRLVPALLGGMLLATALLFSLEYAGVSSKVIGVQIPDMLRSFGFTVSNIEKGIVTRCESPVLPAPAIAAEPRVTSPAAPVSLAKGSGGKPTTHAQQEVAKATQAKKTEAVSPPPVVREPVSSSNFSARSPASISAKEAWAVELSLRPWRNMPLPMVNVANALSSSALILLLALAGMVTAWRGGLTRADRLMATMFLAVPAFAFGPQTVLWALRTFTAIYPATIEEVRAIGLIMIPALYFILRLFARIADSGERWAPMKAAAVVAAVLALPLLMKNLPHAAREGILSAMMTFRVVDSESTSSVANARVALGLSAAAPFFYATQGVRQWLTGNTPPGAKILTSRDDLLLLRDKVIVGPRQVGATTYYATAEQTDLFLQTSRAIGAKDTERLRALATTIGVDFVVVPWRIEGAPFADEDFSVIDVRNG